MPASILKVITCYTIDLYRETPRGPYHIIPTWHESEVHCAEQGDALGLQRAHGLQMLHTHALHVLRATCIDIPLLVLDRSKRRVGPLLLLAMIVSE